jgi:chorismate mutase
VIAGARRHGLPVVVNLGERPELAAAAVAAGADGLWLDTPSAAAAGQAREAAARLAPLVRPTVPGTLEGCRAAIDAVDAVLATLLEHRVTLAGRVQRLKPVGGHAGRDPRREAAIVAAMAERAPSLPPEALARIVTAVIEAGLDVAEADMSGEPPVWRL